jgi:hypothetical protein
VAHDQVRVLIWREGREVSCGGKQWACLRESTLNMGRCIQAGLTNNQDGRDWQVLCMLGPVGHGLRPNPVTR